MLRTGLLAVVFTLAASVASAETIAHRGQSHNQTRVSLSINIFVPAATDSITDALKAQENIRRKIYEAATRECAVLLDVLASECRLEAINVGINRYYNPNQPEGFNVNGNMTFRVTQK